MIEFSRKIVERFSRSESFADAAMSTRGLHGGRILPVVLLDTADRPDLDDLIGVHRINGPGDLHSTGDKSKAIKAPLGSFLTFIRPMEIFAIIEFDIVRHGLLLDLALSGQGIYIARSNGDDDRFRKAIDRPKLLVELADTGFGKKWNEIFHQTDSRAFSREWLSKSESKNAAMSAISELRKDRRAKDERHNPGSPAS